MRAGVPSAMPLPNSSDGIIETGEIYEPKKAAGRIRTDSPGLVE
jgi:hypothetical protein